MAVREFGWWGSVIASSPATQAAAAAIGNIKAASHVRDSR
jgi:hypothetical protein